MTDKTEAIGFPQFIYNTDAKASVIDLNKVKVVYTAMDKNSCPKLDDGIRAFMKQCGYREVASGFHFKDGQRDFSFEKKG